MSCWKNFKSNGKSSKRLPMNNCKESRRVIKPIIITSKILPGFLPGFGDNRDEG
jgi:hypothetical protein